MPGLSNTLMRQTDINLPIWQAPLPFSLIDAALAGRISTAGALGMIYIGEYATETELKMDIETYKQHHAEPAFCFYHPLSRGTACKTTMPSTQDIHSIYAQLDLPSRQKYPPPSSFSALLSLVLDAKPRLIGFARGLPSQEELDLIHEYGVMTFAVCHSVSEAVVAEDVGIDIIVLQGSEAGGLHSCFPNRLPYQPQPALTLLSQVRGIVNCPLVVWGDFSSGCDVVAALIAGAQGVMFDRPFLSHEETRLTKAQQQQLDTQNETYTKISTQFSTLPMRLLPNPLTNLLHSELPTREMILHDIFRHHPEWRPLCVSATACIRHANLAACLNYYREDMANYLV